MNKQQIFLNKQKSLEMFKRSSLYRTSIGNAKCWGNTTYSHFMTIAAIVWKLSNQGYDVYTEIEFLNGLRADVVALDLNGNATVIEVLHTESNERFNVKLEDYPLPIVRVDTKGFDVETWNL